MYRVDGLLWLILHVSRDSISCGVQTTSCQAYPSVQVRLYPCIGLRVHSAQADNVSRRELQVEGCWLISLLLGTLSVELMLHT